MADLGISVNDNVKSKEVFGTPHPNKSKVSDVFQIRNISDKDKVFEKAWAISKEKKLPVVIVVIAGGT